MCVYLCEGVFKKLPLVSKSVLKRGQCRVIRNDHEPANDDDLTYLTVPITFILRRIGLVEFVLQLSDQIFFRVHYIEVLVLMPVPFVLLVLTGAADVIEDLPQFVSLGWPCRKHISVINMDT